MTYDKIKTEYEQGGMRFHIFGDKNADVCMLCGMENHFENEISNTANMLYEQTAPNTCKLVVFETVDWNGDFSPWRADAVFGNKPFAGNAEMTLERIREILIPFLTDKNILKPKDKIFIAGYSLSGLFALWAFIESGIFDGAASCSGSLWFPGWLEYIEKKNISRDAVVYLSLGSGEENTKNKTMAYVGDNTRNTYKILKENSHIKNTVLVWNKGGHFSDPTARLVNGMLWLIKQK